MARFRTFGALFLAGLSCLSFASSGWQEGIDQLRQIENQAIEGLTFRASSRESSPTQEAAGQDLIRFQPGVGLRTDRVVSWRDREDGDAGDVSRKPATIYEVGLQTLGDAPQSIFGSIVPAGDLLQPEAAFKRFENLSAQTLRFADQTAPISQVLRLYGWWAPGQRLSDLLDRGEDRTAAKSGDRLTLARTLDGVRLTVTADLKERRVMEVKVGPPKADEAEFLWTASGPELRQIRTITKRPAELGGGDFTTEATISRVTTGRIEKKLFEFRPKAGSVFTDSKTAEAFEVTETGKAPWPRPEADEAKTQTPGASPVSIGLVGGGSLLLVGALVWRSRLRSR